jgi:hypothetical protein
MTSANISTSIRGHVLIKDKATGEVVLDKFNAIHNKNMATAIARGLAHDVNGVVYKIKLGNGGSVVNVSGEITYLAPNVIGASANLYNSTYEEVVDDAEAGVPAENSVTYQVSSDPVTTAIVICSATIAANEPSGQIVSDSAVDSNPENQYAFDELGLFTEDDRLLTHIIFSPILKTSNRELVITYTLTVSVS